MKGAFVLSWVSCLELANLACKERQIAAHLPLFGPVRSAGRQGGLQHGHRRQDPGKVAELLQPRVAGPAAHGVEEDVWESD